MNPGQLQAFESAVNDQLALSATALAAPITDGVVDVDQYLASSPKILWVLKEPYDEIVNGVPTGGGFSITRLSLAAGDFGNKPPFAPMAYVAFSVFNGFPPYHKIKYVTEDPCVKAAIKRIAYINVNKMPALSTSGGTDFASIYARNRSLLLQQISVLQPDILIFGSTISLFLADLGLQWEDLHPVGSLKYCVKARQLIIDAYHPSQWSQVSPSDYVDQIVSVIQAHSPVQPPTPSPVLNPQS